MRKTARKSANGPHRMPMSGEGRMVKKRGWIPRSRREIARGRPSGSDAAGSRTAANRMRIAFGNCEFVPVAGGPGSSFGGQFSFCKRMAKAWKAGQI